MTQVKAHNKFDMAVLRRRARKVMKKKHGKKVKLRDIDKIWREFVEYGITRKLLKYGKVQVDERFCIEIVAKKMIHNPKTIGLAMNGLTVLRGGLVKEIGDTYRNRVGLQYKIKVTDKNFKGGKLVFEADRKLAKRVHEELMNKQTYYRIE